MLEFKLVCNMPMETSRRGCIMLLTKNTVKKLLSKDGVLIAVLQIVCLITARVEEKAIREIHCIHTYQKKPAYIQTYMICIWFKEQPHNTGKTNKCNRFYSNWHSTNQKGPADKHLHAILPVSGAELVLSLSLCCSHPIFQVV